MVFWGKMMNILEELKSQMGVDRRTDGLIFGSLTDSKSSSFLSEDVWVM